jgi:hypothetical protein
MGYTNVREYGEGKKAWIAAGLPVEGRSRRPRHGVDKGIQQDQCLLRHSARHGTLQHQRRMTFRARPEAA